MRVKIYDEFGAGNSAPVFKAFGEGVIKSGDTLVDTYEEADVVVIWSILFVGRMAGAKAVWERAQKDGKPVIVIEVGALKRNESWKVGINGINRDATWVKPFQENRRKLFDMEPKESSGTDEFITICTQRPDSTQWPKDLTIEQWVRDQIEFCNKMGFNLPFVVRPHPRDKITDWGFLNDIKHHNVFFDAPEMVQGSYDSFNHEDIFKRSWLVINHSSGPGIQAALEGINVITSESSLAYEVALDRPEPMDKIEWCEMLAHTEWFVNEIAEGTPWQHLKNSL